jgi:hypothetical protein
MTNKETRYGHNQSGNKNTVTVVEKTMTHKMWYLRLPPKMRFSQKICDSGACGNYRNSSKWLFNGEGIKETIMVGNGKSMTVTKVGSLNLRAIQLDGSELDITLHVVIFWVNFVQY